MHFSVNGRNIETNFPVYIVAEMSANHGQDFNRAIDIIHAMKNAGADAVKIQTYTPDTMTIRSDSKLFKISGGTVWDGQYLYDLYGKAYTPWEWQPKLKEEAEKTGLDFFSTAFDPTAVEFLEKMGVAVHKVASYEIVDIPLIEAMAKTGKPLIISTGMATLEEVQEAVETARKAGAKQIALLKCTSLYPAPLDEMNLRTIPIIAEKFDLPVGLSDHTLDVTLPVAAVALGACIVEKHFTLSREFDTPDSKFSLEPHEFAEMVRAVRAVEKALGTVHFGPTEMEKSSRTKRRSLFVVGDIKKGEKFTEQNVKSIRPGHGLHTRHLHEVINQTATEDIPKGTPLEWKHVAGEKG
ncbi:MAG: pseudaminic acid synthase [Planctomycetota bacterium]